MYITVNSGLFHGLVRLLSKLYSRHTDCIKQNGTVHQMLFSKQGIRVWLGFPETTILSTIYYKLCDCPLPKYLQIFYCIPTLRCQILSTSNRTVFCLNAVLKWYLIYVRDVLEKGQVLGLELMSPVFIKIFRPRKKHIYMSRSVHKWDWYLSGW